MTPPTAVIDTADWRLAVPLKTALDLTGSRLTAAMTRDFGGAPAASVDSADGSITWTPDPATGLTSSIVITVPKARRGTWLASQALTLIFDVHRTVEGSDADEHLGRSSLYVMPASDSAFVAQRRGGANPILAAPYGSAVLLPALQTGPQGRPGLALPPFPDDAATVNYTLSLVDGALVWTVAGAVVTPPDPGAPVGVLDFSDPASSGLLTAFFLAQPAAPAIDAGALDFSDPNGSGLLPAFLLAAA